MSPAQRAPVSIRLAQSEDISKITKIQIDSIRILCAQYYNASQIETLLENKKQGRNWKELIFVAEIQSQIVGFSALSLIEPTINGVFVDPAFIRQGIGQKLLAALENEAGKNRARCLWVSASLNAVQFYESQGYQTISRNTISLASGVPIPVVTMKKVLIPPTRAEIIVTQLIYILVILFLLFAVVLRLLFAG
ncbi:GNAT family N-acetyltransferase [Argonema galeatum]|uniref:GNAT family N-acetyltransferase n=1 Tax=Argonema galeatum TaxID=2942762 RepID=UPI00201340CF|nr:GNAT family N-acetyltransferase [Argonema galeatum A003/A1]